MKPQRLVPPNADFFDYMRALWHIRYGILRATFITMLFIYFVVGHTFHEFVHVVVKACLFMVELGYPMLGIITLFSFLAMLIAGAITFHRFMFRGMSYEW